ncbi:MAG: VWA domain-containing protein [Hyphomicrobiales bacterium]
MRRLPIYLLIDVSGSMEGEPIEAVQKGIENLVAELRKNPYALETAYLSVITFSSKAVVESELTELMMFNAPKLQAYGLTSLGDGMRVLCQQIESEVRVSTMLQKGDWKPLVFIMTDGSPTDNWKFELDNFHNLKTGAVVACGAGSSVDSTVLLELTSNVVYLDTPDAASISDFFKWVSASIQVVSSKLDVSDTETNDLSQLPPPPKGINLVKS